ncbi:uncharacterized protein [Apostichopus japonicus]|uniref:uncharacterized protein isoform X1 n=1 Tax=Stichopus japonicus TaxID=307972 RepID=UPI003AB13A2D
MFSSEGFLPGPELSATDYWMIKFSEGRRPTKFPPEWELMAKLKIPRLLLVLEGRLRAERMPNDRERRHIIQTLCDYMLQFILPTKGRYRKFRRYGSVRVNAWLISEYGVQW